MQEWALTKRLRAFCHVVAKTVRAEIKQMLAKRLSLSAPNPYQHKKTGRPRHGK
jgi:hypothetical protein